jgi:hypothetical protein
MTSTFSRDELEKIRWIINQDTTLDGKYIRWHVEHCLNQIINCSTLLSNDLTDGHTRRIKEFQLPFNVGRLQEIVHSIGGKKCWWSLFSSLYIDEDYDSLANLGQTYKDLFLS